jgi:hypothetical protein
LKPPFQLTKVFLLPSPCRSGKGGRGVRFLDIIGFISYFSNNLLEIPQGRWKGRSRSTLVFGYALYINTFAKLKKALIHRLVYLHWEAVVENIKHLLGYAIA